MLQELHFFYQAQVIDSLFLIENQYFWDNTRQAFLIKLTPLHIHQVLNINSIQFVAFHSYILDASAQNLLNDF